MKTLWHDPVWSKVIAGAILGGAAFALAYVPSTWWPVVGQFLADHQTLGLIIALPVVGLVNYGIGHRRARKCSSENGLSANTRKFDREFSPKDSLKFYALIADLYDQRNSEELLHTHRAVVTAIKRHIASRASSLVLDLGGGTGKLIAHHFFDNASVKWVYVDACGRMAEKFRENLSGVPLRTEAYVMTLSETHEQFSSSKSDVVVMSFLLSSLPERPDFVRIAGLLREDGVLIVAEAVPVVKS